MSLGNLFGTPVRDAQIVLVMQGDQACWFRWRTGSDVESFTETIERGQFNRYSHCPWIRIPDGCVVPRIRLVLDGKLDEVDRVKAPGLAGDWMRHWQCWRMSRSLKADYPSASLYRLAADAAPDALSIVHHLLPEHWQSWLQTLQEELITVTHVVSSIELLCRHAATQATMRQQSILFDMPVGQYSRHLLVDRGVPLFMRLVSHEQGDEQTALELREQSLAHIREQIAGKSQSPCVAHLGAQYETQAENSRSARLLAGLCVGESVAFQILQADGSADVKAVSEAVFSSGCSSESAKSSGGYRTLTHRLGFRHDNTNSRQWKLSREHPFAESTLRVSVRRNRLQRRIELLQKATILCAWMAAATAVAASIHGVSSARERARLSEEQQKREAQKRQVSADVSKISSDAAYIVSSLELIDTHEAIRPVQAETVLATVADAMQNFPTLVIDELSWVVQSGDAEYDTTFTSTSQVPAREELWHEYTEAPRLQLEVSGKIGGDAGLRGQQQTLEQFVDTLSSLSGVSTLKVLESPVTASRSSTRRAEPLSSFRLTLLLGVS